MLLIALLISWAVVHHKLTGNKKGTGGDFVASAFLATLPFALVMALFDYLGTESGQTTLLVLLAVGLFSIFVYLIVDRSGRKRRLERQLSEAQLIQKVEHVTKQEYVRGLVEEENLGWVRASSEKNREAVEESLMLLAAKLGANGLIKFSWQTENETYQAGRGPKGNPYYKNRKVYSGEAVAVLLKKQGETTTLTKRTGSQKKKFFQKYTGDSIILDGNNIVGRSGWKFNLLIKLLRELRQTSYDYVLFFDNNIYRALKENDYISGSQSISESLASLLGENQEKIVVSPKGEQADPYIIEYAARRGSAIVSNDGYDEFLLEYPWLNDHDRTLGFEIAGEEIVVPKLNLAPVSLN